MNSLTYVRTFDDTKWQPLYVPFEMSVSDLQAKGIEVAYIDNIWEDGNDNGGIDMTLMAKKLTTGVVSANTPYLVRATKAGMVAVEMKNVKLEIADGASLDDLYVLNASYFCSFVGVYNPLKFSEAEMPESDSWINKLFYIPRDGELVRPTAKDSVASQRWYLMAIPRGLMMTENLGTTMTEEELMAIIMEHVALLPNKISIKEKGNDGTTDIDGVTDITDSDSNSAPASDNCIYDITGRRLQSVPQKGMYIVGGRKYVK